MKQKRYEIALCLIIVLQVLCIIYWGNIKEGYHIDEIYSYGLANSYYAPFMDSNGDYWNEWHDSDYLLRYVTVANEHRFAYTSVYYNQTQDVHPFMYYVILHTVCSFFPRVFSKWFAIGVNCVFSVLILVILYNMSKKLLKGGKTEALILCVAYALSAGAISNAVYLRMYVMLTFVVMLYAYLHILLYEGKSMYIPIMLCLILGGLTHYYFYIFAFFISAFYCIYKLELRQLRRLILYVVSMLVTLGINVIIYPSALEHIFAGYRGQEAVDNLQSGNMISKVSSYIPFINMELFGGLIRYIIATVAIIIVVIFWIRCVRLDKSNEEIAINLSFNRNIVITQKTYIIISLLFAVLGYLLIVPTITTIVANRYIFCLYPFILMLAFMFVGCLAGMIGIKGKKYLILLLCASCFVTLLEYKRGYVDYLYQGYEETSEEISEYGDLDVLYVSDYLFPVYRDMMFLDRAERFMPVEYKDFDEYLNNIYTEKNEDGIVVYIYKEHESQNVLDILRNELGYTEFTLIAETYQSNVYLCR
jgi:hypothetical protein